MGMPTKLDQVIAAYLAGRDSGAVPSREELLARHPDLAEELAAFFAAHDKADWAARSAEGGPAVPATAMNPEESNRGVLVFLSCDLVNSAGMKRTLGDVDYARCVAAPHNALFREVLARFPDAKEHSYTGDGFLATFARVSDAVNAGLLFHHALRIHSWQREAPRTRIGIHLGEAVVLAEPDLRTSLVGSAIDICARVMSLGQGGQTLLTRAAFDVARQYILAHPEVGEGAPLELRWLAHGRYLFQGSDEPMEVFEVGAAGVAPLRAPPSAEKAKRVDSLEEEQMRGWRPARGQEIPRRPRWVIERHLGDGSFGEAWLARHAETHQPRVFKFCFDGSRLRSFRRELALYRLLRDALGHRDDIAPLLEVSFDSPPFYLEGEFIEGGNLRGWADRRGLSAVPLQERLAILAKAARAVAAAHSLSIVHRDIKPSNIFIRENGDAAQPLLADFGIGMLSDPAVLEQHGLPRAGFTETVSGSSGTRLYMAPETQLGRPTTAAGDVYALGVLLYQLAVGDFDRPLATGWERDIDDDLLREDIRAAVEREPAARPAAAEVAERLETLEQRRSELRARLRAQAKQLARRRLLRVAISAALVLVVLVAAAVTWRHMSRQAEFDRLKSIAEAERRKANEAKENGSLADARDHYLRGADTYERIINDFPSGDLLDVKLALADVRIQRGIILSSNRDKAATAEYDRAEAVLKTVLADHPMQAQAQLMLAEVYHNRGIWHSSRQTVDGRRQALEDYDRAGQLRSDLCKRDPHNRAYKADLARSYGYMGDTQLALGRDEDARSSYIEAERLRKELVDEQDADWEAKYQLGRSIENRGRLWEWQGESQEALKAYQEYLEHMTKLPPHKPPLGFERDLPRAQLSVARMQLDLLESVNGEPERLLKQARDTLQGLQQGNERDRSLISSLVRVHVNLGKYHLRRGDEEKAKEQINEGLKLLDELTSQSDAPLLADDEYYRAASHALLSQLPALAAEQKTNESIAMDNLHRAVVSGYCNSAHLTQDLSFALCAITNASRRSPQS
jgi:serine/threonine protein kinase